VQQEQQPYAEPDRRRESHAIDEPARRRDFSEEWRSLHDSQSKERKPVKVFEKG
jgi:hypothetical protein